MSHNLDIGPLEGFNSPAEARSFIQDFAADVRRPVVSNSKERYWGFLLGMKGTASALFIEALGCLSQVDQGDLGIDIAILKKYLEQI